MVKIASSLLQPFVSQYTSVTDDRQTDFVPMPCDRATHGTTRSVKHQS